jgi:plastocyanin
MTYDEEAGSFAFKLARLEIAPGDTVIWINDDPLNEHNVAAYPDRIPAGPEPFESPMFMRLGESWSATFTVPGSYYYHCHPHEAVMRGLIVVGRESSPEEFRALEPGEMEHEHGIDAHWAAGIAAIGKVRRRNHDDIEETRARGAVCRSPGVCHDKSRVRAWPAG